MRAKPRRAAVTWLMPLATTVQFCLPRWLLVPVARFAGLLAFRFNHRQRRRILENLTRVLGPHATGHQVRSAARRAFQYLATNYLDLLRTPVLKRRAALLADFDPVNLDQVMAQGRGAVLVTAHVGNWDLAGVFLTALGYPLSAVVEPIPAGWTRTFNRYRTVQNMETIPIPERHRMGRAIEQGRLLALVADRDLTGRGILCPAFGARRSFPKGPAAYALKYGVPVVVGHFVFQHRPGRPPYHGFVSPALRFEPTGDTDADITALTNLIARELNALIARYPDQWLAFRADWL